MSSAVSLGSKFTCFKCECKFYDLSQTEPLCPRCGADQREDPNPDPREAFLARFRRPSRRKPRSKKKVVKAAEKKPEEEDSLLDDDFAKDAKGGKDGKDGKDAKDAKKKS